MALTEWCEDVMLRYVVSFSKFEAFYIEKLNLHHALYDLCMQRGRNRGAIFAAQPFVDVWGGYWNWLCACLIRFVNV